MQKKYIYEKEKIEKVLAEQTIKSDLDKIVLKKSEKARFTLIKYKKN